MTYEGGRESDGDLFVNKFIHTYKYCVYLQVSASIRKK